MPEHPILNAHFSILVSSCLFLSDYLTKILFTRNSPYYHLLKYLLFLLEHPVYYKQTRHISTSFFIRSFFIHEDEVIIMWIIKLFTSKHGLKPFIFYEEQLKNISSNEHYT